MKQIKLTQGQVALVDNEDYERLSAHKWYAMKVRSGRFYAVRSTGKNPHRKRVLMAREILNAPAGTEVDHVSGDTLDHRRSNLRLATHAENQRNRGKYQNNTSGLKGVSYDSTRRKWRAQIKVNGKVIYLGHFADTTDAARTYDGAALQLHGAFARMNFEEGAR
ncbi:MAG: HNH endonuclease [Planctomycetota bacterium]